jgi:hypothetical protein
MGTNILDLWRTSNSPGILASSDVPSRDEATDFAFGRCYTRHTWFTRRSFNPVMQSELAQQMTPLHRALTAQALVTIEVCASGVTNAHVCGRPVRAYNVVSLDEVGEGYIVVGAAAPDYRQSWTAPPIPCAASALWFSSQAQNSNVSSLGNTYVILNDPQPVNVSNPQRWAVAALAKLNDLENWPDNWDEAGSAHFGRETVSIARQVLEQMRAFVERNRVASEPHIVPLPDGSIRFEWANDDKEMFLTILGELIEVQRWRPLSAVDSERYEVIPLSSVHRELEWLTD